MTIDRKRLRELAKQLLMLHASKKLRPRIHGQMVGQEEYCLARPVAPPTEGA